jgi:heme oxygenase (mycobilin-producing)
MIKVVIERQLKNGKDIGRLLLELQMIAVQQKGHVCNEVWADIGNDRHITVLSTWQSLEDWKTWESSKDRAKILSRIEPLLDQKTKIDIYDIMSPSDFTYFIDPQSWLQDHEHPHFEG